MAFLVNRLKLVIIAAIILTTLIFNLQYLTSTHDSSFGASFGPGHPKLDKLSAQNNEVIKRPTAISVNRVDNKDSSTYMQINNEEQHKLADLSCEKYGGPSNENIQEIVYWSDIPQDSKFISPFYKDDVEQYMTFEPDGGGWNNIRMAMETVIVMAHAMGRTLVIPPAQKMYLLGKQVKGQKVHFSFADFFHLDSIGAEHEGLKMISMQEFLERTAMKGKLVDKDTGKPAFPPTNRTNWDGLATHEKELYVYLRSVTHVENWKPGDCLAVFPSSPGNEHIEHLETMKNDALGFLRQKPDDGNPIPVNAPTEARLREALGRRKKLCIYDEEMQDALVVHFMCYHKERARLLTHFYAFIFFEDWKHDLWAKRFVRDHLRYIDELQCAAARVVQAVRTRSRQNERLLDPNGEFDSFHVRRGDFQFKATRIEASAIYENTKDVLEVGRTVFIATDERDKTFFDPLKEKYDLCFLDDFKHLFQGLNTNYYGMLDQLIASKGRVFIGAFFSTFTGFINRIRGYYIAKHKLLGYEDGTMKSYYYAPIDHKFDMTKYQSINSQWNREFPISWRDIDKDIE